MPQEYIDAERNGKVVLLNGSSQNGMSLSVESNGIDSELLTFANKSPSRKSEINLICISSDCHIFDILGRISPELNGSSGKRFRRQKVGKDVYLYRISYI